MSMLSRKIRRLYDEWACLVAAVTALIFLLIWLEKAQAFDDRLANAESLGPKIISLQGQLNTVEGKIDTMIIMMGNKK